MFKIGAYLQIPSLLVSQAARGGLRGRALIDKVKAERSRLKAIQRDGKFSDRAAKVLLSRTGFFRSTSVISRQSTTALEPCCILREAPERGYENHFGLRRFATETSRLPDNESASHRNRPDCRPGDLRSRVPDGRRNRMAAMYKAVSSMGHRAAGRELLSAVPAVLGKKLIFDPTEIFQSAWHVHHRSLLA